MSTAKFGDINDIQTKKHLDDLRKQARKAKKDGNRQQEQKIRGEAHQIVLKEATQIMGMILDTDVDDKDKNFIWKEWVKKVKETSSKDHGHEWALKELKGVLSDESLSSKCDLKIINDALTSVKMDKQDYDKEHPEELKKSSGTCPMVYVVAGLLVISLGAAIYKSTQNKK